MKKDYVYQDKDQFKLMQNATRIGGFVVGDQGIIPAEQVLPEQKFAHQPILRRPPEEVVATPYYYLPNSSSSPPSVDNEFLAFAHDTKRGEDWIFKAKGLVRLQEPTSAALDFEDKIFKKQYVSQGDIITFSSYFLSPHWGRYTEGNIVGHPCGGFNYLGYGSVIVFGDYVFYLEAKADLVEDPDGTFCPQTGKEYLYQNQTYWMRSGKLTDKILANNLQKIPGIPYHNGAGDEIQAITLVYTDNGSYYLMTYEWSASTSLPYWVRYVAGSLDGPWSFQSRWVASVSPDPTVLSLLQSKTVKELAVRINPIDKQDRFYGSEMSTVYGLSINAVYGRGKDTEMLRYSPGIKYASGKRTPMSYKTIQQWNTKWKGQLY